MGPYILLIVLNLMIIYKATRYERIRKLSQPMNARQHSILARANINGSRRKSHATVVNKRKAQMTRAILIITFMYIASTLPSTIFNAYLYDLAASLEIDPIIINLMNGLQFSYSALNIFILFFTNKLFAKEFKELVFKRHSSINPSTLLEQTF